MSFSKKLHGARAEYKVKIAIGAENIDAKGKEIELTINVVGSGYSQDEKFFDAQTFAIK